MPTWHFGYRACACAIEIHALLLFKRYATWRALVCVAYIHASAQVLFTLLSIRHCAKRWLVRLSR
jgi:hypothetical protein